MQQLTQTLKLGLLSLVFFSATLFAQQNETPIHKIYTGLGVEFYLPESWKLITSEDLGSQQLANFAENFKEGNSEILINTASVTDNTSLVDNLVLSLSDYQIPSHPRKVKAACQALPKLLATSLNAQINLTQCEARKIQNRPSLVLAYTTELNSATQVLHYLVQLEANLSLSATLTYQQDNSSSAAAFEAAMLKLEFKPQAAKK